MTPQDITDLTDEYIRENGFVTIEFATTPAKLDEIRDILTKVSRRIPETLKARWVAFPCVTCTKHHGAEYTIHVSIETSTPETLVFDALGFQSIDDRKEFLLRRGGNRTIEQETELALIDDLDFFGDDY